jgi:hypothetical protein
MHDGQDVFLLVRWDEANNTFSLYNPAAGTFGPAFAPGSPNRLENNAATLHLRETSMQGSGPQGAGVTLQLAFSVKPTAASCQYVVEVAAADDAGHQDDFLVGGTRSVAGR